MDGLIAILAWLTVTGLLFYGDLYFKKKKAKNNLDEKKIKELNFLNDNLNVTFGATLVLVLIFIIYLILFS